MKNTLYISVFQLGDVTWCHVLCSSPPRVPWSENSLGDLVQRSALEFEWHFTHSVQKHLKAISSLQLLKVLFESKLGCLHLRGTLIWSDLLLTSHWNLRSPNLVIRGLGYTSCVWLTWDHNKYLPQLSIMCKEFTQVAVTNIPRQGVGGITLPY